MIFNRTKIIFISILFFLFILILSLIFYIFISLTGCSEQNIKIDDDFVCFYSKKDWNYIKNTYPDELCAILSKYKNTKSKLYNYTDMEEKDANIELIKITLDKIRPFINRDGGDVEFIRFEDGIVYVKMIGACEGCALIDSTLSEGIKIILMEEVPGVIDVRLAE